MDKYFYVYEDNDSNDMSPVLSSSPFFDSLENILSSAKMFLESQDFGEVFVYCRSPDKTISLLTKYALDDFGDAKRMLP